MSTPGGRRVLLVAAVADNGVIGADGGIPWHLPGDFAHFRAVTAGHTLVMGRTTHESIGRPLPGRPNVVVTANRRWQAPGVEVAHSVESALAIAEQYHGDVAVIGGARVYAAAMAAADVQVITEVHSSPVGDTHYPAVDWSRWREARREPGPPEPGPAYEFVWWERVSPS